MNDTPTRHIDGSNAELSKSELYIEILNKLSNGWANWKIFRFELLTIGSNAELAKSYLWV